MHQYTNVTEEAIRVDACSADDVPETRTIGHRLHETYFFKCETIYLYFIEVFQGIRNYVALNLKRNSERTWRIFGCFARSKEHCLR